MKKYYLGIDLGSTTSKAVIINDADEIIGRGITNTRANYKVAADIARDEAIYDARFTLLQQKLNEETLDKPEFKKYMHDLKNIFKYGQFKRRMDSMEQMLIKTVENFSHPKKADLLIKIKEIIESIRPQIHHGFIYEDIGSKNQFFRDIVSEKYNSEVDKKGAEYYEPLMLAFD